MLGASGNGSRYHIINKDLRLKPKTSYGRLDLIPLVAKYLDPLGGGPGCC